MNTMNTEKIRQMVRSRYGKIATGSEKGCGGDPEVSCCGIVDLDTHSKQLGYSDTEITSAPEGANMGLGCGNPQAIASLKPGETVLDLGSGGGFDCFLAAKAVGHAGRVIGVDMTAEMLSKARENAKTTGMENVEFRLGEIENLPVADNSIDVIISNCVINLSPEKQKVYAEAYRVLKNGGRLAISDVVAFRELPVTLKENPDLVCGCVGGAETVEKTESMLKKIGFSSIEIITASKSKGTIEEWFPGKDLGGYVTSASIVAAKAENP